MTQAFNKANVRQARIDLENALKAFGEAHGFNTSVGGIRFTDGSFDAKITVAIKGAVTKDQAYLNHIMSLYNLKEDGLMGHKLVGYKRANHKYPFIYENGDDGKLYKCDTKTAKAYFAA